MRNTNVCMAGDKTELMAHYLEAEMIEVCGAARGCRGWPGSSRLKQVRGWLKGVLHRLEVYRKKWCTAEERVEAQRAQLTEAMVLRAFECEERRKSFASRWAEVKEKTRLRSMRGPMRGQSC